MLHVGMGHEQARRHAACGMGVEQCSIIVNRRGWTKPANQPEALGYS